MTSYEREREAFCEREAAGVQRDSWVLRSLHLVDSVRSGRIPPFGNQDVWQFGRSWRAKPGALECLVRVRDRLEARFDGRITVPLVCVTACWEPLVAACVAQVAPDIHVVGQQFLDAPASDRSGQLVVSGVTRMMTSTLKPHWIREYQRDPIGTVAAGDRPIDLMMFQPPPGSNCVRGRSNGVFLGDGYSDRWAFAQTQASLGVDDHHDPELSESLTQWRADGIISAIVPHDFSSDGPIEKWLSSTLNSLGTQLLVQPELEPSLSLR